MAMCKHYESLKGKERTISRKRREIRKGGNIENGKSVSRFFSVPICHILSK